LWIADNAAGAVTRSQNFWALDAGSFEAFSGIRSARDQAGTCIDSGYGRKALVEATTPDAALVGKTRTKRPGKNRGRREEADSLGKRIKRIRIIMWRATDKLYEIGCE
jgi:hypothetical protein